MIKVTGYAYLFCIIAGLVIYFAFLILTVLIAFLVRGLKAGRFLKSRRFLLGAVYGIVVFPCLSVLTWRTYLLYSFHSIVNNLKTCDRIEITLQPSLYFCLGMAVSDYNDMFRFVDNKFLRRYPS
jgi:hypothetical protein